MHEDVSDNREAAVVAERNRRDHLWQTLLAEYPAAVDVPPGRLRDLSVFGGAQGIWVDKAAATGALEAEHGVTVGLLHTGPSLCGGFKRRWDSLSFSGYWEASQKRHV